MKYYFLALLCVFTGHYSFSQGPLKVKHALIFAIGDYPEEGGWPKISSEKDVPYIRKTLENQGFSDDNIRVVTDAQATIGGIKNALAELISRVNPGDIAVIHFSCHGEQVEADTRNKVDGLDECVVTYNCVVPAMSTDFNKDQAEYLRGHVLGDYIKQLRTKLGPDGDVLIFMDFCHSGGGTRGDAKVRGGQPPFVSKGFNPQKHRESDSSIIARDAAISSRGDESKLSSFEVISATRPEELDMETKDDKGEGIGSLTYAISKSFEKLDAGTTYRSLFAKIQTIMNQKVPAQHPLLEGNGANRALLGGAFIHQQPFIEIVKIEKPNQIIIKAGSMAGLNTGAKVSVYPAGTVDSSKGKRIATGTVTHADLYTSTVRLDKPIMMKVAAEGWIFVSEHVFKEQPITINVKYFIAKNRGDGSLEYTPAEINSIKSNVARLPLVKFDDHPELLIIKGPGADTIKIASNGYKFSTIKSAVKDSSALIAELQRYAQYKFLQSLEIKDPNIQVEVKLVPVINGVADTNNISQHFVNGLYQFQEDDVMVLWVKNKGRDNVYVNILDMQPDGLINPILPYKEKSIYPPDLKLKAGEQHLFDQFLITLSPPFGTELFKVFASRQEIDVEDIASTKGEGMRGNLSVLEGLVKHSYGMRGAPLTNISKPDGATFNLLFTISPKK